MAESTRDIMNDFVEDILKRLSLNFQEKLVFAGVIDRKAKLIHFQKGEISFLLPIHRQNALDVQMSLLFMLVKQLEDLSGSLDFAIFSFSKYESVLVELFPGSSLYVVCKKGAAANIADMLTRLLENSPCGELNATEGEEFVEEEWFGK